VVSRGQDIVPGQEHKAVFSDPANPDQVSTLLDVDQASLAPLMFSLSGVESQLGVLPTPVLVNTADQHHQNQPQAGPAAQ